MLLDGTRGLLIDMDGVLHVADVPIPGAVETLAALRVAGVPFRVLTNAGIARAVAGAGLRSIGFEIGDDEVLTSASAAADLVRRRFPGQPCYVLASPSALPEFVDIPQTSGDDARVVVLGDAMEGFTWEALNHVFRLLHAGAALVATHRGRWWQTAAGPTIDVGAFVTGLEYAARVKASVAGKPSAPFFRAGFRSLGLPASQVLMIGDDIEHDVLPAMRLGARGVLVRTGKFREGDLAAGTPDAVLDSFAALPSLPG